MQPRAGLHRPFFLAFIFYTLHALSTSGLIRKFFRNSRASTIGRGTGGHSNRGARGAWPGNGTTKTFPQ
jgi:hypothetical protein